MELCSLPVIYLGPNYGGGNEDNGDFPQKISCMYCYTLPLILKQATTDPCIHQRFLDTHRQVLDSLLWGHCSFVLGPGAQGSVVPSKSLFPSPLQVLAALRWVNGDLLQEGLCQAQVCCTQSPCPCGSPLPTRTSAGDARTQFCLSLCGSLGPGAHRVCLSPVSVSGGNGV